jgi:glycine dehydrogenase
LVQSPDVNGILHDFTELFKKLSETKTIKVVASDLLALTITKPPGEMGADICFGSAQRFGIPMGYGGPYAGFFATKNISIDKK